jgi:hypothetical protein
MSTVMYCYRVKDTHLWACLDAIRADYHAHNMAFTVMANIAKRGDPTEAHAHARAWAANTDLHVSIQLFQDGDTWLLRVLEGGYFFLNHWEHFAAYLMPVFYDDRTDVPEADLPNKAIAERMDALITARRYLLAVVVDADELMNYFFETRSTP